MVKDILVSFDRCFETSRQKYRDVMSNLNVDGFVFDYEKEQTAFFEMGDGLKVLLSSVVTPTVKRRLMLEIDENIQRKEEGYFAYLENVFGKQYRFISRFTNALNLFFNHKEKADILFQDINSKSPLTEGDFVLAIQMYHVVLFDLFENFISENYINYERFLIPEKGAQQNMDLVNREAAKSVRFDILEYSDVQLSYLFKQLQESGFIDGQTKLKTFKHILLQKNLSDEDIICWVDTEDNKVVNKKTLLEFISKILVVSDSAVQNNFIVKFFKPYIGKDFNKKSLNNSRRDFDKEVQKSNRRNVIKAIFEEAKKL